MKRFYVQAVFFILCLCFMSAISINVIRAKGECTVEGQAECVIEQESGRILYEARGDTRLPMASTTKILTAITVLENCSNIDEEILIPSAAVGVEGSSVYLKSEEKYTVKDLLYGLMLRSGNDCAVALALHIGGSIGCFSAKMNEIAQKAGALDSRFENPHGLPCKNHYTTARDLCYITRYAMQNPQFAEIVATEYYMPRNWKNKNKMLQSYEGAIGVKTGYTKEAGRCLVSAAKRGNMTVICTVLNCRPMYERSEKLINDAFSTYTNVLLLRNGTKLTVNDKCGVVTRDYYYPLSEGERERLEIRTSPCCTLKSEKKIGQFGIYLSKRLLFSGNLYKL